MDLSLIVPCCNEADGVPKLRAELLPVAADLARTRSVEIIFVDDGSVDDTWAALHAAFPAGQLPASVSVRYERHAANRGLGAALRTGFAAARGEVIVTTDSDGTYKFATIPALLERLAPDVDLVTASPYHPGGAVENVPGYRLFFSQGASLLYRFLVAWRVNTYTCLFRAYRRAVIKSITFEADGFLAGTELMVKAMLAGHAVAEYPAVLHAREAGASKARIVRTVLAHLGFQWQVLLHRLGLRSLVAPRAGKVKQGWTASK